MSDKTESLVVLTVDGEDLEDRLDEQLLDELRKHDLEHAVLETARKYMQINIDGSDWFSDSIYDAARAIARQNGIECE